MSKLIHHELLTALLSTRAFDSKSYQLLSSRVLGTNKFSTIWSLKSWREFDISFFDCNCCRQLSWRILINLSRYLASCRILINFSRFFLCSLYKCIADVIKTYCVFSSNQLYLYYLCETYKLRNGCSITFLFHSFIVFIYLFLALHVHVHFTLCFVSTFRLDFINDTSLISCKAGFTIKHKFIWIKYL